MCCICINCSACCLATTTCLLNPFLFAQTLLFPQYKHALSGSAQFVEGHTLLEERVSLAKMVGDGTESTICIAAVDAIVLSSLWHRSLLLILLLCCRVSFHDSNKAPEHLLHSIAVHLIISYRARSLFSPTTFGAKELRERFPHLGILRAGICTGSFFFGG